LHRIETIVGGIAIGELTVGDGPNDEGAAVKLTDGGTVIDCTSKYPLSPTGMRPGAFPVLSTVRCGKALKQRRRD